MVIGESCVQNLREGQAGKLLRSCRNIRAHPREERRGAGTRPGGTGTGAAPFFGQGVLSAGSRGVLEGGSAGTTGCRDPDEMLSVAAYRKAQPPSTVLFLFFCEISASMLSHPLCI